MNPTRMANAWRPAKPRILNTRATRESVATITIQKIGDLLEIWSKTRIDLSRMS